jgi:hypothetical protein
MYEIESLFLNHPVFKHTTRILCFVGHEFRYNRVKKSQLDAQLILSIFCQLLHVSGLSRTIIRRYKSMYTTVGTYFSF